MSRAIPLFGVHDHTDRSFECDDKACLHGEAWLPLTRKQRRWIRRAETKAAKRARRRSR